MHKVWKQRQSKHNKLVLIKDQTIYLGNPSESELNKVNAESAEFPFSSNLFSIPFSYIKRIENQKGKNQINFFLREKTTEEIHVEQEHIKNEIFQFLKTEIPKLKYSSKKPSLLKYTKDPLFAFIVLSGLFSWTFYLATQMENGYDYELVNGLRMNSSALTGLILGIANFGTSKIILGYLALLSINILAFVSKLKSRTEIEFLIR